MANIETSTDASRVIYLDSADATEIRSGITGYGKSNRTTDCGFQLQESIVVPAHHTILLSLHSCAIPYSFYNFQRGRNTTLTYSFCDAGTLNTSESGDFPLVSANGIVEGNYTILSLLTLMSIQINEIDQSTNGATATPHFGAKFNSSTLKCEWLYTRPGKRLRFKFQSDQETNFKEEIGFNENCFVQGTATQPIAPITGFNFWIENLNTSPASDYRMGWDDGHTGSGTLINFKSQTQVNAGDFINDPDQFFSVVDVNFHIRSLYLRTNITQHSVLDSSIGSRFSNILARIPINAGSGGELVVAPSDGAVHQLILKVREITFISLRLTDKDNQLINLNGLDFQVALQFDFIETPTQSIPVGKREKVEAQKIHKFLKDTGREKELKEFVADERNKKFLNV